MQKLVSVPEAFESVTGDRPPNATWRRWILTGIKSRQNGVRVRLETFKVGGRVRTTTEAVRKFISDTSAHPADSRSGLNPAAAKANAYLEKELGS